MSVRMRDSLMIGLAELRHEPTAKRIRAVLSGAPVVDTTRALLLWEPRRIVPSYAVPEQDVLADLRPASGPPSSTEAGLSLPRLDDRPVLDPSVAFAVHTTEGQALDVAVDGRRCPGAAFRPADPQLDGYVVLDFDAFDGWFEEDEQTVAHPKDPFHRLDVLAGTRHVRLELDGALLAESSAQTLLFETMLPTRYYLPRADVRVELAPSPTRTWCAYKGQASYSSPVVAGEPVPDLVWSYPAPLREVAPIRDLVCFFDERVDVVVDGERRERPSTPWSPRRLG